MQSDEESTPAPAADFAGNMATSVGALEDALTTLVERMNAEIMHQGDVTEASAGELRRLRVRAEQILNFARGQSS